MSVECVSALKHQYRTIMLIGRSVKLLRLGEKETLTPMHCARSDFGIVNTLHIFYSVPSYSNRRAPRLACNH